MPFSDQQLRDKAGGIVAALSHLTSKERNADPNEAFVEDYNNLRKLVAKAHPDLDPLLPPSVVTAENSYGMFIPNCTYAEVHAFCEQIVKLVKT